MKDVILTAELTLAAVLGEKITAHCAAKRHTGMRVKGILSAEWWNSSKILRESVVSYSTGLEVWKTCPSFIEFWLVYPFFIFVHSGIQFWKLLDWKFKLGWTQRMMSLKILLSSCLRSHKTLSLNKQRNIFSFIPTPKRTCIQFPPRSLLFGQLCNILTRVRVTSGERPL